MRWTLLRPDLSWDQAVGRFPRRDAYFLAEYHRAHQANGDGEALAFLATEAEHALFYPFLLRPIQKVGNRPLEGSLFDIETAHGYSGPLATTEDPAFLARAWQAFGEWCSGRGVVAEFARFHPFLENHRLGNMVYRQALDRMTVAVDLSGTESDLWSRYPPGQRNQIRSAIRRGLSVCIESPEVGLPTFLSIYRRTMDHLGANAYYYFSDAYFLELCHGFGSRLKLLTTYQDGQALASGMFLVNPPYMHYHLGGSLPEYRALRPNNLLLHEAFCWGQSQGLSWLHMGGGRSESPADSLLHFKLTFSRRCFPYYLGRRIHRPEDYEGLCQIWLDQCPGVARPPYFLVYRLPLA